MGSTILSELMNNILRPIRFLGKRLLFGIDYLMRAKRTILSPGQQVYQLGSSIRD